MLTSDGAMPADSPALPPIRLADFSTLPRRALSSRHRSDSELRSLFHREAAAVVALSLAGLRLPQCSSHRRDDLAYQLHSDGLMRGIAGDGDQPHDWRRFARTIPTVSERGEGDGMTTGRSYGGKPHCETAKSANRAT
jgi:hypothetical protein